MDIESRVVSREAVLAEMAQGREAHGDLIDAFHRYWYGASHTWGMTYYERVPLMKNPLDLWVQQDIIWELKPTLIIETGTAFGGSALFYARCLDKRGPGAVISIDVDSVYQALPVHSKLSFLCGSSTDPEIVDAITQVAKTHPRVMVVLDSDHSAEHVRAELDAYAPLVTPGQYLIVEDTNITGHPVATDWKGGQGPHEAVEAWLPQHPEFVRDPYAERYVLTMHPGGWLKRMA